MGVTGSIAAYKSALIIRHLIKEGASVKVIMTKDAINFISPLTLSTLSKSEVLTDLFDNKTSLWTNHVELGLWADLMVVAPASANTIAKFANGLCDNLLTAVYLSARCPVTIAPAMDEDMWNHSATKDNIDTIFSYGNHIIPVEHGELASGLVGSGRMAEPEIIVDYIKDFFTRNTNQIKALSGKKALVTAGPTHEAIDAVRYIGNHSSGKMGIALAEALAEAGAAVELVLGPIMLRPKHQNIQVTHVTSAHEMYIETDRLFNSADITIMAAAVADYTPQEIFSEKIKKDKDQLNLKLVKTVDILHTLGQRKKQGQMLAGFALETSNELVNAKEKLQKKNLDFIVLNSLNDSGAGFQHDSNQITIIDKENNQYPYKLKSKRDVANDIVKFIITLTSNSSSSVNGVSVDRTVSKNILKS